MNLVKELIIDYKKCSQAKKEFFPYLKENIDKYVDFEIKTTSGVYLINDFYVGKSEKFINRITSHIEELTLSRQYFILQIKLD